MSTAARCTSISVTPKGGTAITVKNPLSAAPIYDPELIEKQYSDSDLPSYYGGKQVKGMRFTTADLAVYKALKKGQRVSNCVVKMESARDTDNTLLTEGDAIVATLDVAGIVTEAVEGESSQDGGPMEYTITIMVCRDKDGTPGTWTLV